jgi:hypothetical protein
MLAKKVRCERLKYSGLFRNTWEFRGVGAEFGTNAVITFIACGIARMTQRIPAVTRAKRVMRGSQGRFPLLPNAALRERIRVFPSTV